MAFVRKTFDFIGKYFIYIVPMFVLSLLPQLLAYFVTGLFPPEVWTRLAPRMIDTFSVSEGTNVAGEVFGTFGDMMSKFNSFINDQFPKFGLMMLVTMISGLLLSIIITPAMFGSVNAVLSGKRVTPGEFFGYAGKYTGKFILYKLAAVLYWFFWGFAGLILYGFVFVITFMIGPAAGILLVLAIVFIIVAAIYLGLLIFLWFPSMVVFEVGVEQGLRRSIKIVRKIFPQILLTVLVAFMLNQMLFVMISLMSLSPVGQQVAGMIINVMVSFFYIIYQTIICRNVIEAENRAYFKAMSEENKV